MCASGRERERKSFLGAILLDGGGGVDGAHVRLRQSARDRERDLQGSVSVNKKGILQK